jgi:hypothetical protein
MKLSLNSYEKRCQQRKNEDNSSNKFVACNNFQIDQKIIILKIIEKLLNIYNN